MLQTPGNPPVGAPSRQRERRPGLRCHPTRTLIGKECEGQRPGSPPGSPPSTQPSQPSAQPASQKTDGQTKQDYLRRGCDLSKTNDKKSKKPKADVLVYRTSLATPTLPSEGEKGIPRLVVTRWRNSSSSVLHVAHVRKRP